MTTLTQDPDDRFNLLLAEFRALPGGRGPAGPVALAIERLFICLLRLLAGFSGRVRDEEVPEMAPAGAPEPPPVPPSEVLSRQSGWPDPRMPEDACGGRVVEPPDMKELIAEAPQVDRSAPPPCRMPEVGVPLPWRARVGKLKDPAGSAFAPTSLMDDGGWPRWRGPGIVWTMDAGLLRVGLKKWVLAGGDTCVHFVTI